MKTASSSSTREFIVSNEAFDLVNPFLLCWRQFYIFIKKIHNYFPNNMIKGLSCKGLGNSKNIAYDRKCTTMC